MVWRREDTQGNEAQKVRYDIVPYLGTTCLDIGCGPRKVFSFFMGLDSEKDRALFGIEFPEKDHIVGDCTRILIFADGAFDLVFSSHTLEHIEDFRAALAEWWRLVRPGGHLIVYLPHRDLYPRIGTDGANPDHKHDFAPEDIVEAMRGVAPDFTLVVNETRDQLREYSFLQVYRREALGAGQRDAPELPAKRAAVVRLGAYGDALWASSLLPHLKNQGYHVTVYTEKAGREILAADPHIDRIIELPHQLFDDTELILYFVWEARKYGRWINTTGAVETRLLPHPNEPAYYWSHDVRRRMMNGNYLEALHDVAGLPHEFHQQFYPTIEEREWAIEERERLNGPLVVVAPTGSGLPKTWPHVQRFMELMADEGIHTIVLGEIRQELKAPPGYGHVAGKALPIRQALALAQVADVVVGTESAVVNGVAMEENLKIVLLSHSSVENLTKHWRNTMSAEPTGLACYPCHRLHRAFEFCVQDPVTKFSACQAAARAEEIAKIVTRYLRQTRRKIAQAA